MTFHILNMNAWALCLAIFVLARAADALRFSRAQCTSTSLERCESARCFGSGSKQLAACRSEALHHVPVFVNGQREHYNTEAGHWVVTSDVYAFYLSDSVSGPIDFNASSDDGCLRLHGFDHLATSPRHAVTAVLCSSFLDIDFDFSVSDYISSVDTAEHCSQHSGHRLHAANRTYEHTRQRRGPSSINHQQCSLVVDVDAPFLELWGGSGTLQTRIARVASKVLDLIFHVDAVYQKEANLRGLFSLRIKSIHVCFLFSFPAVLTHVFAQVHPDLVLATDGNAVGYLQAYQA